jgi:hypothetical protein
MAVRSAVAAGLSVAIARLCKFEHREEAFRYARASGRVLRSSKHEIQAIWQLFNTRAAPLRCSFRIRVRGAAESDTWHNGTLGRDPRC